MAEESHEEKVKKIRNVVRVLAGQWLLTKHFDIKTRQVIREFADWLDGIMNEDKEESN